VSLRAEGIALAILSQKLRHRVQAVLAREGLRDAFACVLGGDGVPALKPDPRGLLSALEALDTAPADGLYVGDTIIDAQTAANAGVPFIAVLSGATGRDEFAELVPLAIIESVAGLPAALGSEVAARETKPRYDRVP
jgi:phosphoglycolate phosphatase